MKYLTAFLLICMASHRYNKGIALPTRRRDRGSQNAVQYISPEWRVKSHELQSPSAKLRRVAPASQPAWQPLAAKTIMFIINARKLLLGKSRGKVLSEMDTDFHIPRDTSLFLWFTCKNIYPRQKHFLFWKIDPLFAREFLFEDEWFYSHVYYHRQTNTLPRIGRYITQMVLISVSAQIIFIDIF